jgi:hypothetical protein
VIDLNERELIMPTDRLARLRALSQKWRLSANSYLSEPEYGAMAKQDAGVLLDCADELDAELEGVLADQPQDDEEAMEAFKAWPRIVELANEVAELKAKLAAPTPADGAPQEQEP